MLAGFWPALGAFFSFVYLKFIYNINDDEMKRVSDELKKRSDKAKEQIEEKRTTT